MFADHWLDRSEPMGSDSGHLPRNKSQDAANRCGVRNRNKVQIFQPLEDSWSLGRPLNRFKHNFFCPKSISDTKNNTIAFCCIDYTKQAIKTRHPDRLYKIGERLFGFIERIFTLNKKIFSRKFYIIRKINEGQDKIREKFSRKVLTWTRPKDWKRQGWPGELEVPQATVQCCSQMWR